MFILPFYRKKINVDKNWKQLSYDLEVATGKRQNPIKKTEIRNALRGYKLYMFANENRFRLKRPITKPQLFQGIVVGNLRYRRGRNYVYLNFRPTLLILIGLLLFWILFVCLVLVSIQNFQADSSINFYVLGVLVVMTLVYFWVTRLIRKRLKYLQKGLLTVLFKE